MYLEIDEGYPGHRKTLRLCALLKCDTADAYPPRMWAWAARSAPDGDLTGMDPVELELALRWRGEEGALYAALTRSGFIDRDEDGRTVIHNWATRTGGAIEKMATRAGMAKERRAHMDHKCVAACRYCAGTLTLRSPARSSQDKTSQDQSSDPPLSGSSPLALSASSPYPERASVAAVVPEMWSADRWRQKYALLWRDKYHGTMGGGTPAAVATAELGDRLGAIPVAERLAAQDRAAEMFGEYLANESPRVVEERHPWAWFVMKFDSLRAPKGNARAGPQGDVRVGHAMAEVKQRVSGEVKL